MKPAHVLAALLSIAFVLALGYPSGSYNQQYQVGQEAEVAGEIVQLKLGEAAERNREEYESLKEEIADRMGDFPSIDELQNMQPWWQPLPREDLERMQNQQKGNEVASILSERFSGHSLRGNAGRLLREFRDTCSEHPDACADLIADVIQDTIEEVQETGERFLSTLLRNLDAALDEAQENDCTDGATPDCGLDEEETETRGIQPYESEPEVEEEINPM